ncbi:MAG: tetratricopeptide repeat protein [Flavobacteriia bacterium]|nr:tetratricopeptide repeat protein [Flavobacteriia bacterium]
MGNEEDFNRDYSEEIQRFEKSLIGEDIGYMDSETFEFIIDHYLSIDDYKKASLCSDMALRFYPSHSNFFLKKALILSYEDQFIEALKILSNVESLETYNIEFYITKALIYFEMDKNQTAIDLINNALCLFDAEEQEDLIIFLADTLYLYNEMEDALIYYYKSIQLSPKNQISLSGILTCCTILNRFEEGIAFFTNYIDEYPYSEFAWSSLADMYRNIEDYEKAIWALEFCLAINDKDINALYKVAFVYMCNQQYDKAIEYFNEYYEKVDYVYENDYCQLAECYEQLADYGKAKEFYHKALQKNIDYSDAWLGLGVVFDLEGNTQKGIEFVEKALLIDSSRSDFYHILATFYDKLDEIEKANDAFEKAMSLSNNNDEAFIDYFEFFMNRFGYKLLEDKIDEINIHEDIAYIKDFVFFRSLIKRLEYEKAEAYLEYLCQQYPSYINLLIDFYPDLEEITPIVSLIKQYKQ